MMNGQLMEMWTRWMTGALQGPNQMDLVNTWWLRGVRDMSSMNNPFAKLWGLPVANSEGSAVYDLLCQQAWDPMVKMQQMCMQWLQVVPRKNHDQLAEHAEALEKKIKEQAKTIDRLRKLLSETGGENNVVVSQLQDLIGEQSRQFKQMTQSMGDYLKSSAEKATSKK